MPREFQQLNELIQSNANPQAIIQQMMSGATPEQKQALLRQAKNYNVPDNILSQIQNMK